MALKIGDKLDQHEIVEDLLEHSDAPRDNFGYRQWDQELGTKLGNYQVVADGTEGAEIVWVHFADSPAGTSNKVSLIQLTPTLIKPTP